MKDFSTDYFPVRLLAHRPAFSGLLEQFRHADFDNYAEPTHDLREQLQRGSSTWPAPGIHYPRLEEELDSAKALIQFYRDGGYVYTPPPTLLKPLTPKAVGSLHLADLPLPHACFYLHFGPLAGIELPLDHYEHNHGLEEGALASDEVPYNDVAYLLEGAFVAAAIGPALEITLTFRNPRESFASSPALPVDFRFPTVQLNLDFGSTRATANGRRVDDAVLVFASTGDPKAEVGELEYGTIRELLKKPHAFEYASEREDYRLFVKALGVVMKALRSLDQVEAPIQVQVQ